MDLVVLVLITFMASTVNGPLGAPFLRLPFQSPCWCTPIVF